MHIFSQKYYSISIWHAYGCFASAPGYAHTVCVGPRVCAYRIGKCASVPSYRDTSCVGNKGVGMVGISNPQLRISIFNSPILLWKWLFNNFNHPKYQGLVLLPPYRFLASLYMLEVLKFSYL